MRPPVTGAAVIIPDHVRSIIAKRVHPGMHYRIAPEAELAEDLRLNPIDLWSISHDLEEEGGFLFPLDCEAKWCTVSDIVADDDLARVAL